MSAPTSLPRTGASSAVPHDVFSFTHAAPGVANVPGAAPSPADVLTTKGISIAGWRLEVTHGSIAPAPIIDTLTSSLAIPMPEMPFASNALRIRHEPSGWEYSFNGVDALRCVDGVSKEQKLQGLAVGDGVGTAKKLGNKPRKGIKVAYAQEWGRSRDDASSAPVPGPTPAAPTSAFDARIAPAAKAAALSGGVPGISNARDYDWTYSTTYAGTEQPAGSGAKLQPATDPATDRIPTERLGPGAEPILFWDEVVLFEDELGDNGTSGVSIKVRVMPSGLLLLSRFFLRVDDVLFRIFDTRIFIDFHPGQAPALAGVPTPAQIPGATRAPTAMPTPAPAGTAALDEGLGRLQLGTPRGKASTAGASAVAAVGAPTAASGKASAPRVVREVSGCEASYAEVKARLPAWKPNDLAPLTDPNWVAATLVSLSSTRASNAAASGTFSTPRAAYGAPGSTPLSAAAPARAEPEAAQITGELDEERWEGEGGRCNVVVIE